MKKAEYLIYGITLLGILVASYHDEKYHRIPLYIFPPIFLISLMEKLLDVGHVPEALLGFGIVLVASLAASAVGMGGGDVIMFSTIAFVIGSRNIIPFFVLMTITIICYAAVKKIKEKSKERLVLPLAPFCLLPYLCFLMRSLIR